MPKEGLSVSQWMDRLRNFASGTFQFERGQRPPLGSDWAAKFKNVEDCPRHKSLSCRNLFGAKIDCVCGYHKLEKVSFMPKFFGRHFNI